MCTMRSAWLPLALCALALGAVGCRVNPVTGHKELVLVGASDELALGHRTHPNVIFVHDGEYYDPELNRYLGTIVMRLHAVSHRPEMPAEFTMLNTSVINAFATPGHVYATRGFLARLENEAQFAAVMGHELAHVTAGHAARSLTDSLLTSLVVGVADSAAGESVAGQLAVGVGQASAALLGLSYSREQERQADRVGTYYMALAGWDPRQAVQMQRLLASLSEGSGGGLAEFLSTHPGAGDRIGEIEMVIVEKDLASARYVQGDGVYAERWERRLRGLWAIDAAFGPYDRGLKLLGEEKHAEALSAVEEALDIRADQAQFHRLKGDALLGLGRTAEARTAYRAALARDPRYVPANIGLGRAALIDGDYAEAEGQFAVAARGFPGSLTAHYGLGLARYHQRRYREASEPLEKVAEAAPGEPEVHYVLARCYDETNQPARAVRSYRQALDAGLSGEDADHARQRLAVLEPLVSPQL